MFESCLKEKLNLFETLSIKECIDDLILFKNECNEENAYLFLSFLLKFQEKTIELPIQFSSEYKQNLNELKYKLLNCLTYDLKKYIILMKDQNIVEIDRTVSHYRKRDVELKMMIDIVIDVFLKHTSKEVENNINMYYKRKEDKTNIYNSVNERFMLLCNIDDKAEYAQSFKCLISTITEFDIKKILYFLLKNKQLTEMFFIALFQMNRDLYKKFVDVILTISYFKRVEFISALPEFSFDFEKYEFNDEILKNLFANKACLRNQIIDHFMVSDKKRHVMIDIIRKYYDLIDKTQFQIFNFNFEEHCNIAKKNIDHFIYIIEDCKFFTEEENIEKYFEVFSESLLTDLENAFLLCENYLTNQNNDIVRGILKVIIQRSNIDKKILTLFYDKYKEDKELFFLIAYHLEKDKILMHMEDHIEEARDVIKFLAILSPVDILFQIHKFKDSDKSLKCSGFIKNKVEIFDENVHIEVINMLEKDDITPLYIRTLLITAKSFKKRHKDITKTLINISKKISWNDKNIYFGFLKCLEIIEEMCVEVLITLPQNKTYDILKNNSTVLKNSMNYFRKTPSRPLNDNEYILRNLIYRFDIRR